MLIMKYYKTSYSAVNLYGWIYVEIEFNQKKKKKTFALHLHSKSFQFDPTARRMKQWYCRLFIVLNTKNGLISCPLSFHRCRYMQYAVVFMFRGLVCLHEWRKQHNKVIVEMLLLLYSEVQQVNVLNDLKGEREAGNYSLNVITMSAVWVSGDDTLSSGPWCVCLHSQTHPSPL